MSDDMKSDSIETFKALPQKGSFGSMTIPELTALAQNATSISAAVSGGVDPMASKLMKPGQVVTMPSERAIKKGTRVIHKSRPDDVGEVIGTMQASGQCEIRYKDRQTFKVKTANLKIVG